MEKNEFKLIKYIFLLLAFLSFSVWYTYFSQNQKFLSLNFFDVGSGDAIFIETPDNFKILIDGGPSTKILDYLGKEMGPIDRKIDLLVLTHPHEDHIFGSLEALNKYDVKMVLGTGVIHTSSAYLELLEKIKNQKIELKIAEQGEIFKFGELELEVLYPFESIAEEKEENLNNSSIVLRVKYKNFKTLLLGDAQQEVGEKLFKNSVDLSANVLKTAHQGSKNGAQNLAGFLEKVNPQIAVILVGENQYGHPHQETLNNLEKHKIKFFRTDKDDSIKIKSDGEKFWLK